MLELLFPILSDYIKVKLFREGQFVVIHVGLGGWVEWVGVLGTI